MAKEVLKTNKLTLRNCLIEISEVPARLTKCDIVLKHELLEFIDIEIKSILKTVNEILAHNQNYNYPVEYLPNNKFEYWCKNVVNDFNYYELIKLRDYIHNSFESKPNNKTAPFPFTKMIHYKHFITYLERKHIIEVHLDYSYLFQRLKDLKYIEHITHLNFMDWLLKNNHITEPEHKVLYEKVNFYTLGKSTSIFRENNFNIIFELYK